MSGRIATWLLAFAVVTTTDGRSVAADPIAPPAGGTGTAAEPPKTTTAPTEKAAADSTKDSPAPTEPPSSPIKPTIELRGRIESDAVLAVQSPASRALLGDLQNGYGFRRVRLGAQGTLGSTADYLAEVDFAGGTVRLRDTFVGLNVVPWVNQVRAGYQREPFTLEGATSSRFLTFLERSPLNQLDPTRNWGVLGHWWTADERLTAAVGVFRDNTNSGGFSGGDEDAWALTGRLTGLPVYDPSGDSLRLIHLGGAFSTRSPAGGVVRYTPDPQSSLLTQASDNPASPFLPGVNIAAASQQLYDLQAAAVDGPLSVQAEWIATAVDRTGGGVVFLHGAYATVSYFLTGEHRGYDRKRAAFDRVAVRRPVLKESGFTTGTGSIELAGRFAVADFSANRIATPGGGTVAGTVLIETTLGVNWYLNDYVRLMANYTLALPTRRDIMTPVVHVFGLRASVDW